MTQPCFTGSRKSLHPSFEDPNDDPVPGQKLSFSSSSSEWVTGPPGVIHKLQHNQGALTWIFPRQIIQWLLFSLNLIAYIKKVGTFVMKLVLILWRIFIAVRKKSH